jgi:predicted NBD/HSP70 family sugar kinase
MNNTGMGLLRKNNTRNRILYIIRNKKKVSKIDIKKISKYSMITVLDTIDSLEREGLIFYAEKANSKKSGRRPTYISLNPGGGYFLGLSFHAAEMSLALLDYCGETLDFRRYVLDQKKLSVPYVLKYMYWALDDILACHSEIRPKIIGLGIGAPGYVDENRGLCVFYTHIKNWHSIPLQSLLAEHIPDIPIFIDHNTNAMLLAYRWLSSENAEGYTSVLISIRSGVRMSFMIGSSLYKGKNYTAGEIGHIKVAGGSRYCPCGKKGCLESEISEKAIRIKILEGIRVNRFQELWKNAEYRESKVTVDLFIRSIQSGDADSISLLDEICDYLGDSITQIVNILNPSRVILNTSLCALGSAFFDRLKTNVWNRGVFVALDGLSLEPVAYGERTAAIGAASIVMERELDFVDITI